MGRRYPPPDLDLWEIEGGEGFYSPLTHPLGRGDIKGGGVLLPPDSPPRSGGYQRGEGWYSPLTHPLGRGDIKGGRGFSPSTLTPPCGGMVG